MNIVRDRYAIIRNEKDVFCGLARNYYFKPLDDIGDTSIKTYRSSKTALNSFLRSWKPSESDKDTYRVVKVKEQLLFDCIGRSESFQYDPNQISFEEYCSCSTSEVQV